MTPTAVQLSTYAPPIREWVRASGNGLPEVAVLFLIFCFDNLSGQLAVTALESYSFAKP